MSKNQGVIGARVRRHIQGLTRETPKVEGFDVRPLHGDWLRLEAFTSWSGNRYDWPGYGATYRGSSQIQFGKKGETSASVPMGAGERIVADLTYHATRRIESGEVIVGFEGVCLETIVLDNLIRMLWPGDYARLCDGPQLQTIMSRIAAHMSMRVRDEEYLNDNIPQLTTRIIHEIRDALNEPDWRRRLYHGNMS